MNKKLIIIGAGGHGKVVADIASRLKEYEEIVFLDDNETSEVMGFAVVGKIEEFKRFISSADFIVAVGNSDIRKKLIENLIIKGAKLATLIHPSAIIGSNVEIGKGTVVMANTVINPCAKIGQGVILNTCSSIDHDSEISHYTHVSIGARIAGTVKVGEEVLIGAGAVVINNIDIISNVIIGAGAVVINDIKEKGTYVGVPARKI